MLHTALIDPKIIIVSRETRQRQENIKDIEDLKLSIKSIGIINPIVVRPIDNAPHLIAGERRLRCALELNLTEVPIRYLTDLSNEEAEIIELEENIKRKELLWKDQVRSIGRIHELYKKKNQTWKIEQTAEIVSLHSTYVRRILHILDALNSGNRINNAESIDQAWNIIHKFAERKAEAIVGDLISKGAAAFDTTKTTTIPPPQPKPTIVTTVSQNENTSSTKELYNEEVIKITSLDKIETKIPIKANLDPILCVNFYDWIKSYSGPKFSLIHCDFPYGNYKGDSSKGAMNNVDTENFYDNKEEIYWNLLEALTSNLDKIMSYSAHMIFWFNMNFYSETVLKLRKVGLMVHDHPLVWHKTGGPGGSGVVPGTAITYPRRTYDTALLCVKGNRPLAKPGANSYAAPTVGNKIHPSQKSESMLRFFLQMVVDETTTMLDPTCGSGASIRVAEDLGAKSVLGLELDENYAKSANARTLQARILRQSGAIRKED